jgi:hypothetical protein
MQKLYHSILVFATCGGCIAGFAGGFFSMTSLATMVAV